MTYKYVANIAICKKRDKHEQRDREGEKGRERKRGREREIVSVEFYYHYYCYYSLGSSRGTVARDFVSTILTRAPYFYRFYNLGIAAICTVN